MAAHFSSEMLSADGWPRWTAGAGSFCWTRCRGKRSGCCYERRLTALSLSPQRHDLAWLTT